MKNKKGFTLVEVVVVLVILAVLAAILIPSFIGYIDKAKKTQYSTDLHYLTVSKQISFADTVAGDLGRYIPDKYLSYPYLNSKGAPYERMVINTFNDLSGKDNMSFYLDAIAYQKIDNKDIFVYAFRDFGHKPSDSEIANRNKGVPIIGVVYGKTQKVVYGKFIEETFNGKGYGTIRTVSEIYQAVK